MREVKKRDLAVPLCLNHQNVKDGFKLNIEKESFKAPSDTYKCKSNTKDKEENKKRKIISSLRNIYEDKCAYCETSLLDTFAHIEHFRPKNKYYWLAYSWSNLLPVCAPCNIPKGEKFEIFNETPVFYNNQNLNLLHFKLEKYNKMENQKLLHPEIDKFEHQIFFALSGKMITRNIKVDYTIKTCDLNRDEIQVKRGKILKDFLNDLVDIYTKDGKEITNFRFVIQKFIRDSASNCEFTVFKKFVIKHMDLFLINKKQGFQETIKEAISTYK